MLKMDGISDNKFINYHLVLLKRYKEGAWCRILLTAETFPPDEMQVIRRGEISAVMGKLLLHVYCYFLQELPCFIIDNLLFSSIFFHSFGHWLFFKAFCEELTRRAADLTLDNETMKRVCKFPSRISWQLQVYLYNNVCLICWRYVAIVLATMRLWIWDSQPFKKIGKFLAQMPCHNLLSLLKCGSCLVSYILIFEGEWIPCYNILHLTRIATNCWGFSYLVCSCTK